MLDYLSNSATLLARLVISGLVLVILLFLLGSFTGAFTGSGRFNVSRLQQGVLALVLVLYVVFPHDLIFVGFHSIALATALGLFLVFQPNRMDWRAFLPYLLFGWPLLVVTLLAIFDGGQLDNALKLRALFLGMLVSLLFSLYFRNAADVKPLVKLFLPVVVAAAVLGIAQSIAGENYLIKQVYGDYFGKSGQELVIGFGFGYNNLIQGMALLGGIAIALFAFAYNHRNRLIAVGLILLVVTALVLSTNQGTWIGGVALILTFALVASGRRFFSVRIALPMATAIIGWGALQFAFQGVFDPSSSVGRAVAFRSEGSTPTASTLDTVRFMGSGSWDLRLQIWDDGLDVFSGSPLWGVGVSNFNVESSLATDSHNLYLSILAETGLIGFVGFLSMHGVILRRVWRNRAVMDSETQRVLGIALSLMVGYWVVGLFWQIEVNRIYWIALGILNGLSCYQKQPVSVPGVDAQGPERVARRPWEQPRVDGGRGRPVLRPGALGPG